MTTPAGVIDPVLINDVGRIQFFSQVAENLTFSPDDGVVQSLLAESWEPNEDNTVWTFHLREGVLFKDGTPMTADDICRTTPPPMVELEGDRRNWCHFPLLGPSIPHTETEEVVKTRSGEVLLELRNLSKTSTQDGAPIYAVADVDLTICKGGTLALVGESGSGKSTLAEVILGAHEPDAGTIMRFNGAGLSGKLEDRSEENLRSIQMVVQNTDSALNRRHSVRRIVGRAIARLRGPGTTSSTTSPNCSSRLSSGSNSFPYVHGSCPAASSSESLLPGHSRGHRSWSCVTNQPRRSTFPFRPRS